MINCPPCQGLGTKLFERWKAKKQARLSPALLQLPKIRISGDPDFQNVENLEFRRSENPDFRISGAPDVESSEASDARHRRFPEVACELCMKCANHVNTVWIYCLLVGPESK